MTTPTEPENTARGAPADAAGQRPLWKVVALIGAATVAVVTMVIGLGSDGLDGGRELDGQWIYCAGQGPLVWLEPDVGEPGMSWEPVYNELSARTRVCTRDRRGLGRSPQRSEGTPTATVLASELESLLASAGEPAPAVLVGHGAGCLTLRAVRPSFPTARVVEVEPPPAELPFHEDRAAFIAELPTDLRREFEAVPTSLARDAGPVDGRRSVTALKVREDPRAFARSLAE